MPSSPRRFDADATRALVNAAFVCDLVRVRELLAKGADPDVPDDDDGRSPLFSAVLGASIGLAGMLLEAGANVNAHDADGWTPLHFTAQENMPEMARLLLAKGADVNAQDGEGNSVLWRAVFSDHGDHTMVNLLRTAGAKTDTPNSTGESPLSLATRLGNPIFTAS